MMRNLTIVTSCVFFFALFSCHKDSSNPSGGNPPTDSTKTTSQTGSMKISLAMPADTASKNNELIISEPGGKILLDTLVAPNTLVNATLSTNAKLVDITTIGEHQYPFAPYIKYFVATSKSVDPTLWTLAAGGFSATADLTQGPTTQAEIYYQHLPENTFQFCGSAFGDGNYLPNGNAVDVLYQQEPGSYSSILFPKKGLYILHVPKGLRDTIDCSTVQYDSAISTNYPSSSEYTWISTYLSGVADTTVPSKSVQLFNSSAQPGSFTHQLIYPRTNKFQKYYWSTSFGNSAKNESLTVWGYLRDVNTNVSFPASDAYVLNSTTNTNFSVTFNSSKPTYHWSQWTSSTMSYIVSASPDSTQYNPIGLLTALKSKILQRQDLSTLKLGYFVCEIIPGYGYMDFNLWSHNTKQHDANPIFSSTTYEKAF